MRKIIQGLQHAAPMWWSVAAVACASTQALVPAADAAVVRGQSDAASSTRDDVRVVAQANDWHGTARISQRVTPLRVSIQNGGHVPLFVRYRDFKLITPDRRIYHALPPRKTHGLVTRRTAPIEPTFVHRGYAVAGPYSYAYPSLSVWDGAYAYDPYYSSDYYPYWAASDLPTPDMIAAALPEGVLQPGRSVSGFLYFQPVKDVPSVRFVVNMPNAKTGRPSVETSIPFRVKD